VVRAAIPRISQGFNFSWHRSICCSGCQVGHHPSQMADSATPGWPAKFLVDRRPKSHNSARSVLWIELNPWVGQQWRKAARIAGRQLRIQVRTGVSRDGDKILESVPKSVKLRLRHVEAAIRIESGGDLHQCGGLDGKLIDRAEARALVEQLKSL
jgi:hypothetical protein